MSGLIERCLELEHASDNLVLFWEHNPASSSSLVCTEKQKGSSLALASLAILCSCFALPDHPDSDLWDTGQKLPLALVQASSGYWSHVRRKPANERFLSLLFSPQWVLFRFLDICRTQTSNSLGKSTLCKLHKAGYRKPCQAEQKFPLVWLMCEDKCHLSRKRPPAPLFLYHGNFLTPYYFTL